MTLLTKNLYAYGLILLFSFSFTSGYSQVVNFADQVLSFSTQYSDFEYAANQVLGDPDVYPNYGDNFAAWASLSPDDQREFLELGFNNPRPIDSIYIYETFNGGAVDTVFVKNPTTSEWDIVYEGAVDTITEARIFRIGFPMTEYAVSEIRIAINSPAVPDWNEIDAVAIVNSQDVLMHIDSLAYYTSELDLEFNAGQGYALSEINQVNGNPWGAVSQSDGKPVVYFQYAGEGIFVRFNKDGSVDSTFNSEVLAFRGRSLTVGPDDALYLSTGGTVYKYNSEGIWDSSFVQQTIPGTIYGMSLQSDGKILTAGTDFQTLIAGRFNTDGTLDSTFSDDGFIQDTFNRGWARMSKQMPDGGIIVQSWVRDVTPNVTALLKLDSAGKVDSSYGENGIMRLDSTNYTFRLSNDFHVYEDGKIVIIGNAGLIEGDETNSYVEVIKVNSDGTMDDSFGNNGLVQIGDLFNEEGGGFSLETNRSSFLHMADKDQFIVNGAFVKDSLSNRGFGIMKINADGSLDETYGDDGIASASFSGSNLGFSTLLHNQDGYVYHVGRCASEIGVDLIMVHFLEEGVVSSTQNIIESTAYNLFPNPVINQANISFNLDAAKELTINLVSLDGRIIETFAKALYFAEGEHTLDIQLNSHINSGFYFVHITDGKQNTFKKLIKI